LTSIVLWVVTLYWPVSKGAGVGWHMAASRPLMIFS